ncbi:MAG: tRNA pseudouridine(38-40) synthase TruA [Maribacter sp.]|nr:tRNA pseudouridine(38-40) synthase TruA [Maribacter sp.]
MEKIRHYYLLRIQFLGFRYSGWQKQPGQKTIEGMLSKTLKFVLPGRKLKVLGAGRTDAKVSALDAAFELFLDGEALKNEDLFLAEFNQNLPPDIRAIQIIEVDKDFNIIKGSKSKEYVYLFSYGQKNHPFCAPFIANILGDLDLEIMKIAAKQFVGTHDFSLYTARLQQNTKVFRCVDFCEIKPNNLLKANFFPKNSFAFVVRSQGFMRYQIRMMMGALVQLGRGELTLKEFEDTLSGASQRKLDFVVPGSGLLLNALEFN